MAINYNRKLFSNFISLSLVQGINFLIPLLVMPYVISRIGAGGYGSIAVAQVVMIYLSTLADYGFNLSATKDIALNRSDRKMLSKIFFTVLASKMLLTTLLFLLLLICSFFLPILKENNGLYLLGFTYVLGQSLLVNWFFQGIEKMHMITVFSLLSRLIFVALVFAFIRERADAKYFLLFLGIGNIISGCFSVIYAIRFCKLEFVYPGRADILYEIKGGWQITVSNLSINTFLYSGIFILRIFTNDLIVGYYSIAERIFFAVRQVLAVFSQVIYPQVCRFGRDGILAGRLFFRKVYLPFLAATIAGSVLLFTLSPYIIRFFVKDAAVLPATLLRMLGFVPAIVCLNIPAYQLLLAFDPKKSYLGIYAAASIINIAANLLLAARFGATGTVMSIIITELFITIGLNRQLYKTGLAGFIATRM